MFFPLGIESDQGKAKEGYGKDSGKIEEGG
jgi:hypothetical protein